MSRLEEKVADLKTITGCIGGLVSRDGACVASSLPPVYDKARLDRVAASIRKIAAVHDKSGYPGADFVLRYGKANMLTLSMGEGAFLTLLCEPNVGIATVEVFANVAADDIREALAAAPVAEASQPIASVPPPQDPAARLDESRQTAIALYGAPLATVKASFIREVGPIGDIIFASALDGWLTSGPIDWQRIGELREVLAAEIEDSRSRATFLRQPVWAQTTR